MAIVENRYQKANRILKDIVAATLRDDYIFVPLAVIEILDKKGFVETNPGLKNEAGEIATRATKTGIEAVPQEEKGMTEGNSVSGVSMAKGFEIEDVAVEATKRAGGGGKKSIYPFEALQVGQSFFVPATTEKPEPWKTMQSTVSGATQKFAAPAKNEDGSPKMRTVTKGPNKGAEIQETTITRKFAITKSSKDGVDGARIGRIA